MFRVWGLRFRVSGLGTCSEGGIPGSDVDGRPVSPSSGEFRGSRGLAIVGGRAYCDLCAATDSPYPGAYRAC